MPDNVRESCPQCVIGLCQPGRATYVHLVGDTLISVPGMRVYTCDVCGYREFEADAVARFNQLIGHEEAEPGEAWAVFKTSSPDAHEVRDSRRLKQ